MKSRPFVLSVKALVRDGASRCLVIKRSASSKNFAGCWDLPGGKVDSGERFDAALIREIAEETGLTVTLDRVLGAGESECPDRRIAYIILEARARGGEVRLSDEHDEYAWLTVQEFADANLCPQFRDFARRLQAGS